MKHLIACLCGALLLSLHFQASAQGSDSLVIPVRVVEGHIMVIGFLSDRAGDINDVSLELSFEDPNVFTLDPNQHAWLKDPAVVKLLLKPGVALEFPAAEVKREHRPERADLHDYLTRIYSKKLDEHKVKGILGAGFLRKYHVALDVAAGTLTLSPLGANPAKGQFVSSFELRDGRAWLPVQYADGRNGEMVLGGDSYHTAINSTVAKGLGKPGGSVSPVRLGGSGGIDLAAQMPFRPRAGEGPMADATFVAGVNFFETFRVEVDWSHSRIAFTPSAHVPYPEADRAFFQAEAEGTAAALQSFLERFPDTYLGPDAGSQLMEKRLNDEATTDDEFMAGLEWVVKTSFPERRMENCAIYVKAIRFRPGRDALVAKAGLLALQHSRGAITVQDIYRLHNIIGEAYLNQGKVQEAWKHFLSAAFMPLDNRTDGLHNLEVNLNLARVYDRMGRLGRAYSRYLKVQSMLQPSEERLNAIPDDAEMDPEEKRGVMRLKTAVAETREALERLKKQIPAEDLEYLEG